MMTIADPKVGFYRSPTERKTMKNGEKQGKVEESYGKTVLFAAIERLGLKDEQYGLPENSFPLIAALWSEYLGTDLTPEDVPAMMILMKLARHKNGAGKKDNAVDIAGYAHCLEETRSKDGTSGSTE